MPPAPNITSLQTVLAGLAGGSSAGKIIGTKRAGPPGIESIIEYRSETPVYLNVVDWVDTFIVVSIAGLDSADLRASAFVNPGEHGETPSDALWGGRTIVLSGKQFAHTIWKLRDMQMGLRGAFLDVRNEYPLIFHAADPANDLMIMCRLADKINIPDQQTTRNEYQRDFQISLRASNPRFLSVIREQAYMSVLAAIATFSTDNVPTIENFTITGGLLAGYAEKGRGFTPGTDLWQPADLLRNMIVNPRGDTAVAPTTGVTGHYDWDTSAAGAGNITVTTNNGITIPGTVNRGPCLVMTVASGHYEADIEFSTKGNAIASPVIGGDKLRFTAWLYAETPPADSSVSIGVAIRWWTYPASGSPPQALAPIPLTDAGFVAKPSGDAWATGRAYRIDTTITVPVQTGVVAFPAPVIYITKPNALPSDNIGACKFRVAEPMLDIDRDPTRGVLYGDATYPGWIYEGQAKYSIARRRTAYANLLRNTRAFSTVPSGAAGGSLTRINETDPSKYNNFVGHNTWFMMTSNGSGTDLQAPDGTTKKVMWMPFEALKVAERTTYSMSFYVRAQTVPRPLYLFTSTEVPPGNPDLPNKYQYLALQQTHGSDGKDTVGAWRRFWCDIEVPTGAISLQTNIVFTTDAGTAIPNGEQHEISAVMLFMGRGPRSYVDGSGTVAGRLLPEYKWAGTAYDSPTLGPYGFRNLLSDTNADKPDTSAYGSVASTLTKIAAGGAGPGGAFIRATYDPLQSSFVMGLSSNAPISERVQYTISAYVRHASGGSIRVRLEVRWYQDQIVAGNLISTTTSTEFPISSDWTEIKLENILPPDKASIAVVRVLLLQPVTGDAFDVDRMAVINRPTSEGWFGTNTEFARPGDASNQYGEALRYNYSVIRTPRDFYECQQTVKLKLPTTNTGIDDMVHLTVAYIDDDNQIYVTMEDPNLLAIIRRDGGVFTSLANVTLSNQADGAAYYVRARMSDGVVFAEAGQTDPDNWLSGNAAPTSLTYTLSDVEVTKYQNVLLPMRFGIQAMGGDWTVDEWRYSDLAEPQGWNVYRGAGTITVKNGRLTPLTMAEKLMTRAGLTYKVADAKIWVKARYETKPTNAESNPIAGVAAKVLDKNNFIAATINGQATGTSGLISINLYKYDNGVRSSLFNSEVGSWQPATDGWVRLVMAGNNITVERWTTDPALGGAPADSLVWTLLGGDVAKFGAGVKGEFGIYWFNPVPESWMDNFVFDLSAFDDIAYTVKNNGNFEAQTTIELTGPMTNPRVTNEANGTSFLINGSIPTGETWVLANDGPSKRMYRKSDGANRFQYLDSTSMWIVLEPYGVPNNIRLTATGTSGGWDLGVTWRHTYM